MSRPSRITFEGAVYHIFNRGVNKQPIYFSEHHKNLFLNLLEGCQKKYDLEIYAYCLMRNHYHLFLKTNEANLSKFMQQLTGTFAQKVNYDTNGSGAVFSGRFHSILVDSDYYFLNLLRYIHLNPVEANICNLPEDYKWSSYQYYADTNILVPSWINCEEGLNYFKNKEEFIVHTHQGIDSETRKFYKKKRLPNYFGSDAYKIKLKTHYNIII